MAIVTSFGANIIVKWWRTFYVLMRVDFEDEEQLDQTTKMVEIGNSIGGHKLTVCLRSSVMTWSVT